MSSGKRSHVHGHNEHKDDTALSHPTPAKLTKRKARNTAPATSTASASSSLDISSPFLPASLPPHRISLINFRRLLSRVESRVAERSKGSAEEKEATSSVKQQTLLIKSLHSLRSQLESLHSSIDPSELSEYVQRVSRLWSEAHVEPLHMSHRLPSLNTQSAIFPALSPPSTRPLLPILSSSSLRPSSLSSSSSTSASPSLPSPSAPLSTHPLADASHFTSTHTRPPPPNPKLIKQQLFASSNPSPPSPTSSSSSLFAQHEAGLSALSLLTPQLKEQVKAISAHLKVDEGVVAETNQMMESNVDSVRKENVRLKGWARVGCGETCWMTSLIVVILIVFTGMVILMKIVPAPRY